MLKGFKNKYKFILASVLILSFGFLLVNSLTKKDETVEIPRREPAFATQFLSEEGTQANPYVVGSKADMDTLSLLVSQGQNFSGKYFTVDANISEIYLGAFTPIGSSTKPFLGNFDGYGVNFVLAIDNPTLNYQGLFGFTQSGVIENLSVSGSVKGLNYVGGIVGQMASGTVRNVYSTATVEALGSHAGGIVGLLSMGSLSNAFNRGDVIAVNNAGGIVGYTYVYTVPSYGSNTTNSISNVYSSGTVTANSNPGGVIGYDNPARYTGSANARVNLYYDISVISNHKVASNRKPSSMASTQGLNSEVFFSGMEDKLSANFSFRDINGGYGFYPELRYFSESSHSNIKAASLESNTVDISNGVGTLNYPYLIRTLDDINKLKTQIETGETYRGFYFKVADGRTSFNLGNFIPIGASAAKPFYGSFDGNNAEFILNISNSTVSYQAMFGYFGYGKISNLSTSGSVSGLDYTAAVVAYKYSGTIENVYNKATVNGRSHVGSIVGRQEDGTINSVYNSGNVTATGTYAGGIVGTVLRGVISNVYNNAEILANNTAGGIIGHLYAYTVYTYGGNSTNRVENAYSSGLVSANTTAGGVIGNDDQTHYSGSVNARTRLYYDTSVLVTYDQPRTVKPPVTGHSYGRTTSDLVYGTVNTLGFPESVWHYEPKSGTTAYYPQLLAFSSSSVAIIRNDSTTSTAYGVGDGLGTKEYPFLIRTKFDMDELSRKVALGNTYYSFYFKVDDGISQIDLANFQPIGSPSKPFAGNFDGNGVDFVLDINNPSVSYQGLFGYTQTGIIENFSVSGSVKGLSYVGGITGQQSTGTIRNVYNTARIEAYGSYAGGIVGLIDRGTLTQAYNTGEIVAVSYAGGVVGYTYVYTVPSYGMNATNSISHVYSSGTATANSYVGGVIGYDNPARYTGDVNVRVNLYYDITVIANYDQVKAIKPSTDPSTQGLNSGIMFKEMQAKLPSGFSFKADGNGYAYYPQLTYFSDNQNATTKSRSEESVKVNVGDGLGTESFPFLIRNEQDIEDLKTMINRGNTFKGFYFKVDNGITEFNLGDFDSIGSPSHHFYGSFDGNNAVFNLSINRPAASYQAMFGYFGFGTIKNMKIQGSVTGLDYTAGLVAYKLSGTVENVYNEAVINGRSYVGGMVGYQLDGTINNVYNNGDVTATGTYAGGIVSFVLRGTISNTYNRAEILANNTAGGIIGHIYAYTVYTYGANSTNRVENAYNSGLVAANTIVGGVIGNDNQERYTGSANARTRLYYDTSILVTYDQPRTVKPPVTGHAYGRTTSDLVYGSVNTLGFPTNLWHYEPKSGTTAYYPQLLVFSNHSVERIRQDSSLSTAYEVGDGLGTKEFPFLIRDKFDMDELSRKVALGNTYYSFHFKVEDGISQIDLENFVPIGSPSKPFAGNFDGNGVDFILAIDRIQNHQGLFGYTQTGIVENFSVSGSVRGQSYVGGIAGQMSTGIIRNVYNTAKVEATGSYAGGIIGLIDRGTLAYAYNRGEIIATSYAGGVVGYTYVYTVPSYGMDATNSISHVYSSGTSTANSYAGGVIGYDNPARYTGSSNVRTNLYYDITVIANYDQVKAVKPSTDPSTQGLNSGILFKDMSGRLPSGFTFKPDADGLAYYPQLTIFASSETEGIVNHSINSVKVDIGDGLGTPDYPFLIRTVDDIDALREKVNKGNTFKGFHFKVDEGIEEFVLDNFVPIGSSSKPFYGSFDGNNAEFIININNAAASYQAMFGYFGFGTIENLSVSGTVTGLDYTAGVVGYKESGTVQNVYNEAIINGRSYVGGIVGYQLDGTINSSYNNGNVTATGTYAGGIVSFVLRGTVSNVYNRAEILANNTSGGVIGHIYAYTVYTYGANSTNRVENAYSSGLVSANATVGGVIGNDNQTRYTGSANVRLNLFYDVSVLMSYTQPRTLKPSTAVSGHGVLKTSMFSDSLSTKFGSTYWTYRDIEGNYAYFPQLKVFATSLVDEIKNDSVMSVRTNPFLGDGTLASPYIISTPSDMVNLSNSLTVDFDALGIYYLVGSNISNIDLSTVEFKAIGSSEVPFRGHFDGNYANFNVNINVSNDYQGLFGNISSEASVKRLSVTGQVTGRHYVAGVIGKNQGEVSEVYSTALINGQNYVGGVIGQNMSNLTLAYNTGQVYSTGARVGGVVGHNAGVINEVYHSNRISGLQYVGGVVGYNTGEVSNAYFNITVIEFFTPTTGIKPLYAVGNEQNTDDVRGVAKEILFNLTDLNLTSTLWATSATTGMYDYLVQLTGFRNNVNGTIKNNSELSARIIRFAAGSGDKNSPYIIRHEGDMKVLSDVAKADNLLGIYFKVLDGVTSFDLTDPTLLFDTIGSSTRKFMGFFDGNNAEFIIGINKTTTDYLGLFGYVENGSIENLTVSGDLTGRDYVGAVVGYALNTKLNNVYSKTTIKARNYVGGIAGYSNNSSITNAYNMNNITATGARVAGISGHAQNEKLAHVFNYGEISGTSYIGGVVGYGDTNLQVEFAYNRNSVKGTGSYVGGIVGYLNNGRIDNTYSSSTIRGLNNVGGVLGASIGTTTVNNSFYDQSLIEADISTVGAKPIRAVGNVLDQEDVIGVGKSYLTGVTKLSLDLTHWVLIPNDGINAFYPQLKVFTEKNDVTKKDSLDSITSYIFAGLGTITSPYIIVNEYDMTILSTLVNNGNSFKDVYFKVRANAITFDMTLTGLNYGPIGSMANPFNGFFDGSGVNFKLGLSSTNYIGLFGYTDTDAVVSKLSTSGTITGTNYVGSVVGYNKGTVNTVYSTSKVVGDSKVGGIVGANEGIVTETYYISTLNAKDTAGGIVGYNQGDVNNSYVVGKLSANSFVGGVIGINDGTIDKLYYNKEIAEIYKPTSGYAPIRAVGNMPDTDTVLGLSASNMHQPTLVNMPFTTLASWEAKGPVSFEVYYPQLSYFSKHALADVKAASLKSVSAMRFKEGTGIESDPYIIRNADDMKAVSDLVLSKNTLKGMFFRVADEVTLIDLDTLTTKYVPIGNETYKFEGSFDGNFARFNLNSDRGEYYQGLFGYIGTTGIVRNLSVSGSVRSGSRFAGGIAGRNAGLIENVYNLATITAYDYYAGGIVGYNNGVIRNAYNNASVTITRYDYAGGIAGAQAKGTEIYDSYNTGQIKGRNYIGGIIGHSSGSVSRTYSIGTVTGSGALGGVIGGIDANAQTERSYYDLSVMLLLTGNKPTKAFGNAENNETVYGLTTSELSGGYLGKANLGTAFKTKPNVGYTAYHPQLALFANSSYIEVKNDSLDSVTKSIFQGTGAMDTPYFILSEADMQSLSLIVSQNHSTTNVYFKVYQAKQTFDLASDQVIYSAIGSSIPFNGSFDGNGATFNLRIENGANYQGLFGQVGSTGSISNLIVTGKVSALDYVGGVVGSNEGVLTNLINQAEVSGLNYVGGIAGINKSIINDSYNEGRLSSTTLYAGGITGYNDALGEITQSFNKGEIHASANYVGGIAGVNKESATIENSFNYGTLFTSNSYLGGITGLNEGDIHNVYNTGSLEAGTSHVAGISALNSGTITEGFHAGLILSKAFTAGVVVTNTGLLSKLYYNLENVNARIYNPNASLITKAVYQTEDTTDVKGLVLKNMTGLYPIGNNDEQMNLERTKYSIKQGNDFTSYYPELLVFNTHTDALRKQYSLESITDKKLEGNGTALDPYIITNGYDMMIINEFILNENHFINKYFKVQDGVSVIDLTLADLWFTPLGDDQNSFRGHLNGNNANFILDLDNESSDYLGIFHTLGTGSSVKNLTVSGQIIGRSYLGGVAGRSYGTIENVTNLATIKSFGSVNDGANSIGGITGVNVGTIKNATNNGIVSALGSYVGGIAGENELVITESYNKASVTGASHVGGITGLNRATVSKTYNTKQISGITVIGGIVGENRSSVTESFNDGDIIASKDISGGIVGLQTDANANTNRIYHSGSVRTDETIAGGIIGKMDAGQLHDAYTSGVISGKSSIGTIVGQYLGGSVSRSYYDINVLENFGPMTLSKPTKAFGDYDKLDNATVKGLYHGQMIGLNSIGTQTKQMNFYYPASFKTTPSLNEYAFYPQITFFANNVNTDIKNDSLESVKSITFMKGNGLENDPYILTDESDIIALAETVNSGNRYLGVYFKVASETDEFNFMDAEENYQFTAIGNDKNPFLGHLDGNGANFKIKLSENLNYQGLFGHVGKEATIKNLSVSGSIKGLSYTAGIAGLNKGSISNVYNQAEIIGSDYVGGIIGHNDGLLENAYNRGDIKGSNYVGGISGKVTNITNYTYNIGVVYGKKFVGAIAGFLESEFVENSFYDTRILGAYRDISGYIKPTKAASNSEDSNTVYGLDKAYMTGLNSIGNSDLQMHLNTTHWTTNYNVDGTSNYPQLKVFSRNISENVKENSKRSTQTTLYTITYDYDGATANNTYPLQYVIPNKDYLLAVPFKFGFEIEGWYMIKENGDRIKYTNALGESLVPFNDEQNITLVANWQVARHEVKFVDGNNNTIETQTVLHGDFAVESSLIPQKNPSLTKIYFFEAWDFDFTTMITKPVTIKATYTEIDRYYNVTFKDGNGNFFTQIKVEYGQKATAPTQNPTKLFDEFAYKFTGWDFNFEQVINAPVAINSIFEAVDRYYKVRFLNPDGEVLHEDMYEYGTRALAPTKPTMASSISENFTFKGWDKPFDSITSTLDVTAVYETSPRYYEVRFLDGDGKAYSVQQVAYNEAATTPSGLPIKTPVGMIAYKFTGWDQTYTSIVSDLVINALYTQIDRYYEVNFVDGDDNPFGETIVVEYMQKATLPNGTPTKAMTTMHEYVFSGWDESYQMIMGDTTVKALFEQRLRPYKVTFMDGDNNVYEVQTVLYGQNANNPVGEPRKTPVGEIAYKFTGWDKPLTSIKEDTVIKANFSEVARYYTVTFYGYDLTVALKNEKVEYRGQATAPTPPIKEDAREAYENVFVGWDKDFSDVRSNLVVKAQYVNRIRTYEVTVINGDQTDVFVVNHGANFTFPTPVKTGSEQIFYKFVRWESNNETVTSLTNVKQNYTVEAIFEETFNYYVVTFVDHENNIIEVQRVTIGSDAKAPLTQPTKDRTEDKVYIFKGWDRGFTDIESDLTIKALFDEYDRYYEVIFMDAKGEELSKQTVEYGLPATAPLSPEKDQTAKFEYRFTGWDKDYNQIYSNLVINPTYEESIRQFRVNFVDGDLHEILSVLVEYGKPVVPPTSATKTPTATKYYVFAGWDNTNLTSIMEDTTVTATFTEVDRYYQVRFIGKDNGIDKVLYTQTVEYGKDAYDPIKFLDIEVIDDLYVWAITGWVEDFTNIKASKDIHATYGKVDRYYTVRFLNEDGSIISEQTVEYGKSADTPVTVPTKDSTVDFRYVFKGYSDDYSFITRSMDLYAEFEELKNQNKVTFIDGNGDVFDTQMVAYGQSALEPDGIPMKNPTKEYEFIFLGWNQAFDNITEDTAIIAEFKEVVRYYTVLFVTESNQVLKEEQVQFGHPATAPEVVTIPEDTQEFRYSYSWSKDFGSISDNTRVVLIVHEELNEYTYTFYDAKGEVYKVISAPYGTQITLPNAPTKDQTEQFIFTFIDWDQEVPEIMVEDLEFRPIYLETIRTYTVTFLDGDGKVFDVQEVQYGFSGVLPEGVPTKSGNQQYYYEFRMWFQKPENIKADTVIEAVYNRFLQTYEVTFIDEYGNTIKKQEVPYGTGATEPTFDLIPTKAPTTEYEYVFAGWDKSFNFITEDTVIKVRYVSVLRLYTYTFYDDDHITILKQVKGRYGSLIVPPPTPVKIGEETFTYRFVGWDKMVAQLLTGNVDYYAVYEVVPVTYKVTFFDGNNQALDLQIINHGESAIEPSRIPTKAQTERYDYMFTGWDKAFDVITQDLKVFPVFEEKIRTFKVTFVYDTFEVVIIKEHDTGIDFDTDPIPTPLRDGFGFVSWDKDLSRITKDISTEPIFKPNRYQIIYYGTDVDEGGLPTEVVSYGSQVSLSESNFSKRGYTFAGWKTDPNTEIITYADKASFVFEETGNLALYAAFNPIVYEVIYDTDGGTELPPDPYTIETPLAILPTPIKADHKFIGWELVEIKESLDEISLKGRQRASGDSPSIITALEPGTIGWVILKARYAFDGFIEVKDEYKDTYSIVNADVTTIIPILERVNEEKPVYLLGVSLNQTIEDLKTKFRNDTVEFLDQKGELITDLQRVVFTGLQVVIRDGSNPDEFKDRVRVVLKGDVNGDGLVTAIDNDLIYRYVSGKTDLFEEQLLSMLINEDDLITAIDIDLLYRHVSGKGDIYA